MRPVLPFALLLATTMTAAQDAPSLALPDVKVRAAKPDTVSLPPTTSTTVIDAAVIEQRQSDTVFDVVKQAPGVSVDGGPRATGMSFNIRGFRDNEDVQFRIDGAAKGFEKYRFGAGVFIEPELIKSITIERGPQLLTGSGAIGGAVIATTKSAADLLAPGQRVGGMTKLGFNFNNDERLLMQAVYGRPTAGSDLLVSWVRRDSKDIRLAHGSRFPATSTHQQGSLIKLTLFPTDTTTLELSRTAYTSGPTYTPFDTNSSNAFVGGYVHQKIADETLNARFTWDPGLPWLKLRGTLAHETTDLDNLMLTGPGESSFTQPCSTDPCLWSPYGGATGRMTDRWKYSIGSAEVFNDARWTLGSVDGQLTIGLQGVRNRRDLRRLTENPLMNLPEGRYPGGFDDQQPPGTRTNTAVVVQNALHWRDLTLTPALRRDRYTLQADGQSRIDLQAAGQASRYAYGFTTRAVSLAWRPGQGGWWITPRWSQGFRPPLVTDAFGLASASPCAGFLGSGGQQIAPWGCADLLSPTRSTNQELSLAWAPERTDDGTRSQVRLTLYRIATSPLAGASYLAGQGNAIVQPWSERRRGLEFEATLDTRDGSLGINYSRILARRFNALDGSASAFTAGIPGPTLNLSAAYRPFGPKLELGYRVRQIFDQMMLPGAQALTETTQYCGRVTSAGVVHAANTQQDVFAIWRPARAFTLNLGINNLFDKHWCHNGDELGNVIGLQGPGRSVRLSMTAQY